MSKVCNEKMYRQLKIFINIIETKFHGPEELMQRFNISRRILQRDLKDLRDAQIIRLELDREHNNYVVSKKPAEFDKSSTGRRRQHLIRLNRIAVLITRLERTDMDELRQYESLLEEHYSYMEFMEEDPENFPEDLLGDPPKMPVLADIKASYYSLFPDSNERMRQRDFEVLNEIGFDIHYSRKYKAFIFDESPEDNADDPYFW